MLKVVLNFLHLGLYSTKLFINSLYVKLGNFPYRLFYKSVYVFHDDWSFEELLILHHFIKDLIQLVLPCPCISFEYLIYLVFKEYLFERVVVPVILEFIEPDLKFKSEKVTRVLSTVSEHVIDTQYLRLVVKDHTGVRGNGDFAGCECVKCIDGLVRRHIIRKMNHDVHLVSGEVIDLLYLYLAGFLGLED